MRALLLAATALAAGAIALAAPARADTEFAYCVVSGFGMGQDCSFSTLAQCQAAARGLGTDCTPNPRFARPAGPAPGPGPRR